MGCGWELAKGSIWGVYGGYGGNATWVYKKAGRGGGDRGCESECKVARVSFRRFDVRSIQGSCGGIHECTKSGKKGVFLRGSEVGAGTT